jgi:hypothetical protein
MIQHSAIYQDFVSPSRAALIQNHLGFRLRAQGRLQPGFGRVVIAKAGMHMLLR